MVFLRTYLMPSDRFVIADSFNTVLVKKKNSAAMLQEIYMHCLKRLHRSSAPVVVQLGKFSEKDACCSSSSSGLISLLWATEIWVVFTEWWKILRDFRWYLAASLAAEGTVGKGCLFRGPDTEVRGRRKCAILRKENGRVSFNSSYAHVCGKQF